MNLLFLSRWCPVPLNNGSKLRVHNLLRILRKSHRVTLISFFDPSEPVSSTDLEQLPADEVQLIPYREYNSRSLRALMGLLNPTPRSIVDTRCEAMETGLKQAFKRNHFDLVIASQLWMASYQDCFGDVPALFEEVELGMFLSGHRDAPAIISPFLSRLSWEKHRRYINVLIRKFAACTVVSEVEAGHLRSVAPTYEPLRLVPNGIDVDDCEKFDIPREHNSIVFSGSICYGPNYDAMNWFLSDIYSLVKRATPAASLTITGATGGKRLPSASGVALTGELPDVRPVVASSAVSIVPLRAGGGTRLKVLESMALRTPVVATSKAVEGLAVVDGRDLLIADSAAEFADAVTRILSDARLSRSLAESAFHLVKTRYDWKVLAPAFLSLVEDSARVC